MHKASRCNIQSMQQCSVQCRVFRPALWHNAGRSRLHSMRLHCPHKISIVCMAKPWRPLMDDVDRLSSGKAAKIRGTGCRDIPHRLNAEERPVYEFSKKKGYLAVRGSGYRRSMRGNPLPNVYRQWCDARAIPCIVIEQDMAGTSGVDVVVVDLAPLRLPDNSQARTMCEDLASELGLQAIPYSQRPPDAVPFNILPTTSSETSPAASHATSSSDTKGTKSSANNGSSSTTPSTSSSSSSHVAAGASSSSGGGGEEASQLQAARQLVDSCAAEVRRLKEQEGRRNQDPDVQRLVQQLIAFKEKLRSIEASIDAKASQAAQAPSGNLAAWIAVTEEAATDAQVHSSSGAAEHQPPAPIDEGSQHSIGLVSTSSEELDSGHPIFTKPVWQLPAQPLFFSADRTLAKQFAKAVLNKLQLNALLRTAS